MKPEDIANGIKYLLCEDTAGGPINPSEGSSELEKQTAKYFNRLVENKKEIFFRSNELVYALLRELREEIISREIDWDRKRYGMITWGPHRRGIINKDGSLTYFDSVDGKAYKVTFDSENETLATTTNSLSWICCSITSIFEVSKKLGIELEGKHFPYLKIK